MASLTTADLAKLGVRPDADVHSLADVQVRKIIAACAAKGAVAHTNHSADVRGVQRQISRDMVVACLKQGGIRRGAEPSLGGGVKLRLRHTIAGEAFEVEVALDDLAGPAVIVTVM